MQFDFGQNWLEFSERALTRERIEQARVDFQQLLGSLDLKSRSFLDIGFGQGLSLLTATNMGAKSVGCDINPKCKQVLDRNKKQFSDLAEVEIPIVIGSILDEATLAKIRQQSPDGTGMYDVVHSWGVLHHTGDLKTAIETAASLVRPAGGYLIIAIYNRHWTSPIWKAIKVLYCKSPLLLKKMMIALFYPIIWTTKGLVTGKNPGKMARGMDFYYDVVDWVGGYPYEYASISEVMIALQKLGFTCMKTVGAHVPTGCNEFLFIRS
jgi:2-polyprenyl-3-methyl-5-hydroxy-6-metoxy-1,4-benzoquinol methylase